jgi:hypothetical protein
LLLLLVILLLDKLIPLLIAHIVVLSIQIEQRLVNCFFYVDFRRSSV